MTDPTPSKLAEAKENYKTAKESKEINLRGFQIFLDEWQDTLRELIILQTGAKSNSAYDDVWWNFIQSLLKAQSLISYEKGREEQRKADLDALIFAPQGKYSQEYENGFYDALNKAQLKINNPTSDAK